MSKNNFHPLVSIVIPVYNGSNYLKDAIDSALAQTYKNIEIIVINDGSTDNGATERIAKSYGNKIKYYPKQNGGVASALNFGIKKMTGDYFSWLSHDDMYKPDRTAKMVRRISKESDINKLIIASSFTYFTSSTHYSPTRPADYTPSHPLSYLFLGYINGCSIIVPKQVILKEGLFNDKLPTTQDVDYWFRLLRNNKLIYLEEELTLSRSHEEQGSKAKLAVHIAECDELWIRMARTLTKAEKTKVFGSELDFYNALYDFLRTNTLYEKAIFYMKDNAFKIIRERGFEDAKRPVFINDWSVHIEKSKKTIFFPLFGFFNDRGGLNKMVSVVANRLSENYNVIIATFTDKTGGYQLNDKITYLHVSTNFSGIDSFEDISLLFDVSVTVVSHNCSIRGLELIRRLEALKKPVVAWNHEDYFLPYTNPKFSGVWSTRNVIFSQADAVVWLTNASADAYSLAANNGVVIPNFVHFEDNTQAINDDLIHNNIIAVARFDDPRKRIDLLLNTYETILSKNKTITLTILGVVDLDMPYSETESIGDAIARINSGKLKIKAVGFVNDIEQYYANSDIHILPSYGEGFGLTILESAYFGVPTAVFDTSGFDEIINDGQDGIIAPEPDANALAHRILELYQDQTALRKMKKMARRIPGRFEPDNIINDWKDLIDRIIYKKTIKFYRHSLNERTMKKVFTGFENSLVQFAKIEAKRGDLMQANENLEAANTKMNDELSAIYNSKRWRYTAKAAVIKGKLLR
jgi:glycosyltransferase involved in cell wall biosynthesis